MKKCNACREEKKICEFNLNKSNKDGLSRQCKDCKRKIDREYRFKKREYNSLNDVNYEGVITCHVCKKEKSKMQFNKNKNTSTGLSYECKECQSERSNNYYKKNKDEQLFKQKERYLTVRDEKLLYQKTYQKNNKEKIKKYLSEYNLKNKDRKNERSRVYNAKRKSEDPVYKFKVNTRSMIYCSFKRYNSKNYVKSQKTEEILGCSMDFFAEYISSLFQEGMSLSNHGEWHLDHIIPLASANTEEEIIKLNHYTNIQPLWAADNMSKGKKIL